MKKFKLWGALAFTCALFTGCNFNETDRSGPYAFITMEESLRTANPLIELKNLKGFSLTGYDFDEDGNLSEEGYSYFKNYELEDVITKDGFNLAHCGLQKFVLEANINEMLYKAETSIDIKEGANNLSFKMSYIGKNSKYVPEPTETGSLSYSLKIDDLGDVNYVSASLCKTDILNLEDYNIFTGQASKDFNEETLKKYMLGMVGLYSTQVINTSGKEVLSFIGTLYAEPTLSIQETSGKLITVENNTFNISTGNIPSGQYVLLYQLCKVDDSTRKNVVLGAFVDMVNISKDLTSSGSSIIGSVNDIRKVNYNLNGGTNESASYSTVFSTYSTYLSLPMTITKPGYDFEGWYLDEELTEKIVEEEGVYFLTFSPESDINLYANYTPRNDTSYTVNVYLMGLDSEYELYSSTVKKGITDSKTTEEPKEIEGFEALKINQSTISGDGSSTVNIYYNRKKITLTFLCNDKDEEGQEVEGLYGANVSGVTEPTLSDYNFAGWSLDGKTRTSLPLTFPSENVTYTALWTELTRSLGISVTMEKTSDISLRCLKDEGVYTISVVDPNGLTEETASFKPSFAWRINGKILTDTKGNLISEPSIVLEDVSTTSTTNVFVMVRSYTDTVYSASLSFKA